MGLEADMNALDRIRARLLETACADKAAVEYTDHAFMEKRSTLNQACDMQPAAPLLGFESSVWSASEMAAQACHMLEALHARIYGSSPENGCGYAEDAIREPDGALERMERALSSLHQNLGRMQGVIHLLAEVA